MHLDFKSEVIQILVDLIYLLQCSDPEDGNIDFEDTSARNYFAEMQSKSMLDKADDYIDMLSEEGFEFLLHAITYFGNKIQ